MMRTCTSQHGRFPALLVGLGRGGVLPVRAGPTRAQLAATSLKAVRVPARAGR